MNKNRDGISADAVELIFLEQIAKRLPEDVRVLQALAEMYTKNNRMKEGLRVDLKLSQLLPKDDSVWYNLACSYALTGATDKAMETLSRAVELGYNDYDWMKADPDLNSLHEDRRFESLLSWLYTACQNEEEL